jgi:hypothetical protein
MSPAVYNDPISYTQSAADQYYRGGVTVRDHRHLPATEWLPPKPVIGTDQNALDDAAISNAQGAADQADAFASQNPNNLAAQNDAQRKDLALQNLFARISEKNKEKAQMQHEAIQASVLS